MTFGIKSINNAGTVQIDEQGFNLELYSYGVAYPGMPQWMGQQRYTGEWEIYPPYRNDFLNPGVMSVFAYSCDSQPAYHVYSGHPNDFGGRPTNHYKMNGTAWNIKWWFFSAQMARKTSGYGINIINQYSQNTFNSDMTNILKIRDMKSITNMNAEDWVMPAGRKYAVASLGAPLGLQNGGSRTTAYVGYQINDNIIRKRTSNVGFGIDPGAIVTAPTWIVDVTGLPNA